MQEYCSCGPAKIEAIENNVKIILNQYAEHNLVRKYSDKQLTSAMSVRKLSKVVMTSGFLVGWCTLRVLSVEHVKRAPRPWDTPVILPRWISGYDLASKQAIHYKTRQFMLLSFLTSTRSKRPLVASTKCRLPILSPTHNWFWPYDIDSGKYSNYKNVNITSLCLIGCTLTMSTMKFYWCKF